MIQCSPPPGKLAESRKPISAGTEEAQTHSEEAVTPPRRAGHSWNPPVQGREEAAPELASTYCAGSHTPGLAPAQGKPTSAHRAGEGGGQGPHSGWREPSQDHTEQKCCPETHGYFSFKWPHWTPPGSQALSRHEPSWKEKLSVSNSLSANDTMDK